MNKSGAIIFSAIVFAILGLVAGYMAISYFPEGAMNAQEGRPIVVLAFITLGSTLGGTILGLIVGIIAAVFWPHAKPDAEPGGADRGAAAGYGRK